MFFYILMIPVLFFSVLMIIHLRRLKKHDEVLYTFCQNRREIMFMIREENFALSKKDYFDLRKLAEVNNKTIRHFNW